MQGICVQKCIFDEYIYKVGADGNIFNRFPRRRSKTDLYRLNF